MSVAFRRDSDEEHKEPRFELPLPPGPNLVTPPGLRSHQGPNRGVGSSGPCGCNRGAACRLQRDLRYWRTRLATAQIAPVPSGDAVAFGTRVTIEEHGRLRSLTIVGHDEAQPASGLIAFASPIGQALMGAEAGEDVTVPPGHGVRIISIAPA